MDQSNTVDTERSLQGCHFKQLVQNNAGIGITLHIDDNTHAFTVRLIINIGNTIDLFIADHLCNTLDKFCLIDIIRYLAYHNLVMCVTSLNFSLCTHHDTSTSSLISFADTIYTIYISSRRKIRSFYILHQTCRVNIIIIDISHTGINYLRKVVRRNISCHTYRNTRSSINKQLRNTSRHNSRFL